MLVIQWCPSTVVGSIKSKDTDVFICLIDHFSRWIHFGMQELWVLKGQGTSKGPVPVHDLLDKMDSSVIDILPAVHALSGCDTTSKVDTKKTSSSFCRIFREWQLFILRKSLNKWWHYFFSREGSHKVHFNNKQCWQIRPTTTWKIPRQNFPIRSRKTCTYIWLHNFTHKRAYIQRYHWLNAQFCESIGMNPLEYGYIEDGNMNIVPDIVIKEVVPEDFLIPCNYLKCARSNICTYRIKNVENVEPLTIVTRSRSGLKTHN